MQEHHVRNEQLN